MRRRIVGLTVLSAVLAICLFGIPLAVAAARYFISDEHNELERTADTTALAISGDLKRTRQPSGLPHSESGTEVSVYDPSGVDIAGPGPQQGGELVNQALRGSVASGDLSGRMAVAVPVSDGDSVTGAVLVTAERSQVYRRIAESWLAMLGLATAAVTVAWLLARRQAQRLARPLERLSAAAERLGGGDFSVRTSSVGVAEIDTVSTALDRTAHRLGSLLERERAFSADASHQLRTPLTGLQLGLEAALAMPGTDLRAAIRDALVAAQRLETTITDLLALARDAPTGQHVLDVEELLRGVRDRWHGALAAASRPLRISVEPALPRTALSSAAAEQILDVLIENAVRHGRGAVTVAARAAGTALAIDVTDEGPSINADPQKLFRRRSAAAGGSGIGLALARRLAESEGSRLVLSAQSPPRFTLLARPHEGVNDIPGDHADSGEQRGDPSVQPVS
ncbi:MAG: HAMP domain-containing histidine kinase [Actinomycetota bacterium]|nr:HAMP domain-containing histidine kinase [Actinomycetota bacterium]